MARKTLLTKCDMMALETATSTSVHMELPLGVSTAADRRKAPPLPLPAIANPGPRHSRRGLGGRLTASICQERQPPLPEQAGSNPLCIRGTGMACRSVCVCHVPTTMVNDKSHELVAVAWDATACFVRSFARSPCSLLFATGRPRGTATAGRVTMDGGGSISGLFWGSSILPTVRGNGAFAILSRSMSRKGHCSPLT